MFLKSGCRYQPFLKWDVGYGRCPRAVLVAALGVSQYSAGLGTADLRVALAFPSGDAP